MGLKKGSSYWTVEGKPRLPIGSDPTNQGGLVQVQAKVKPLKATAGSGVEGSIRGATPDREKQSSNSVRKLITNGLPNDSFRIEERLQMEYHKYHEFSEAVFANSYGYTNICVAIDL